MKTRHNPSTALQRRIKRQYVLIAVTLLVLLLIHAAKQSPAWVEQYYSRLFYPAFSYLPKLLVGWVPFSVGDVFYFLLLLALSLPIVHALVKLFKKQWLPAWFRFLQFVTVCLVSYAYFYVSWGLNYYRIPLQQQLQLQVDSIDQATYFDVLDRYIVKVNTLRNSLDTQAIDRAQVEQDIEALMKRNEALLPMLSRTQVHAKRPISSTLVSYVGVTGYLNPFTQEVQVNAIAPGTGYPFTVAHELAHQMGIGFEDECNFTAFVVLHDHPNKRYQYAAYYETVDYLLQSLYMQDEQRFRRYVEKLSPAVKSDYAADRLFWQRYRGPVDRLMGMFYGNYLKHNNQPEGVARYSLMARLVVAWDKKNNEQQ